VSSHHLFIFYLLIREIVAAEVEGENEGQNEAPAGADLADVDPNSLQDIDFDDGQWFSRWNKDAD
jgi:hypothetical protein